MSNVGLPAGYLWASLSRGLPRKAFDSGQAQVNSWLQTKALQHQDKRLSITKILQTEAGAIAGFYSLATSQVDFGDLPPAIAKGLPRRALPVAVLAWLGVDRNHQGRGLGRLLVAQALLDCYLAGQTFAFIAVVLDCVDDAAKAFYQQFDFKELPGRPYRLFLNALDLQLMIESS